VHITDLVLLVDCFSAGWPKNNRQKKKSTIVALPAAAWYFPPVVRFSLCERKTNNKNEDNVPL